MARDGAGNMTVPYPDFVGGTTIVSAQVDSNNADIVAEITNSIARDGQSAPTANIPFGGNKITGLGAGSDATDSANLRQVQAAAYAWCGTATGTSDAIVLTPSPAIAAYAAGQVFRFVSSGVNTTAVTVAISGLSAKDVKKTSGGSAAALVAGDIKASGVYEIAYDGTQFRLIDTNLITYADMQDVSATKRALGRNTAGSGDVEEVTATQVLDWVGTPAQGDVLYRGASAWALLPAGTDGHFLKTKGAAANPEWSAVTVPAAADQTEMESASSATVFVSPARQIFHPAMPKAWALFNGTTTGTNAPTSGYGVTSVTRNATGTYTINFSTNFSGANYAFSGSCSHSGSIQLRNVNKMPAGTYTASAFQVGVYQVSDIGSATLVDSDFVCVFFYGDQ